MAPGSPALSGGELHVRVRGARRLASIHSSPPYSPYVLLRVGDAATARTRAIADAVDADFNELFVFSSEDVARAGGIIEFEVRSNRGGLFADTCLSKAFAYAPPPLDGGGGGENSGGGGGGSAASASAARAGVPLALLPPSSRVVAPSKVAALGAGGAARTVRAALYSGESLGELSVQLWWRRGDGAGAGAAAAPGAASSTLNPTSGALPAPPPARLASFLPDPRRAKELPHVSHLGGGSAGAGSGGAAPLHLLEEPAVVFLRLSLLGVCLGPAAAATTPATALRALLAAAHQAGAGSGLRVTHTPLAAVSSRNSWGWSDVLAGASAAATVAHDSSGGGVNALPRRVPSPFLADGGSGSAVGGDGAGGLKPLHLKVRAWLGPAVGGRAGEAVAKAATETLPAEVEPASGTAHLRQALLLATRRPLKERALVLELVFSLGRGAPPALALAAELPLLQLLTHSPPPPRRYEEWLAGCANRLPGIDVPLPGLDGASVHLALHAADADCRARAYKLRPAQHAPALKLCGALPGAPADWIGGGSGVGGRSHDANSGGPTIGHGAVVATGGAAVARALDAARSAASALAARFSAAERLASMRSLSTTQLGSSLLAALMGAQPEVVHPALAPAPLCGGGGAAPLAVLRLTLTEVQWLSNGGAPPAGAVLLLRCGPHWLRCDLAALPGGAAATTMRGGGGGTGGNAAALNNSPPPSPRSALAPTPPPPPRPPSALGARAVATSSPTPSSTASPPLGAAAASPSRPSSTRPTPHHHYHQNHQQPIELLIPVYTPGVSVGAVVYTDGVLAGRASVHGQVLFRPYGLLPLIHRPRARTLRLHGDRRDAAGRREPTARLLVRLEAALPSDVPQLRAASRAHGSSGGGGASGSGSTATSDGGGVASTFNAGAASTSANNTAATPRRWPTATREHLALWLAYVRSPHTAPLLALGLQASGGTRAELDALYAAYVADWLAAVSPPVPRAVADRLLCSTARARFSVERAKANAARLRDALSLLPPPPVTAEELRCWARPGVNFALLAAAYIACFYPHALLLAALLSGSAFMLVRLVRQTFFGTLGFECVAPEDGGADVSSSIDGNDGGGDVAADEDGLDDAATTAAVAAAAAGGGAAGGAGTYRRKTTLAALSALFKAHSSGELGAQLLALQNGLDDAATAVERLLAAALGRDVVAGSILYASLAAAAWVAARYGFGALLFSVAVFWLRPPQLRAIPGAWGPRAFFSNLASRGAEESI